jgi:isoleucyl-tRNA synthetase
MKNFKELDKRAVHDVETDILKEWKRQDILNKTIENRKDKENWVFYDGPIYANAKPGIHHVLAKAIKDSFCKYKTMQGYRVLRKIGLDTHGLPIEVNVEKKLGFKTKADIEEFGVENFCKECNKATALNIDEINTVTDMMGQFIDCEHPYVTCDNEYIESEWWIVKEMDKKGLLYHGNKVLPYCPRCGTELSSNEVSQGYEEVSVNTVIVPFKKKDCDEYFLVWTTTPWTLMANVALCVNPDLTYIKVESKGYKFILAESLAEKVLGNEYEVLETYKGKDLVGIKYEQFLPFVEVTGKAFEVVSDGYVTAEDGTGIVHIAPAYGEDDNRVCHENGIAFVNPVGKDGCYLEGLWKGRIVTDSDLEVEIIKYLKEQDKLFKKIKMTHDYPHCWRCHSPLIYYAKPAWYIKTTAYKEQIIEANKKVNWYPEYVGTKRFNNWLENMVDWGISRNRYWGCPLPVWTCEKCNHIHVIGSLEELQKEVLEDVDVTKMELHRPYVDTLHIKCPECGEVMSRVKDVLDVWFDSGSMPYAQFHYPFENKELFESQFPADFIAEGIDQTRGWFYVLLVISTIISGESSFKNVVVNDMVLDQYGKKMSKSTGNIVDPTIALTQYGADNVRWYMFYASPVWTPLKYDEAGVKEVHSKFFNPLKNTYSFFQMYANTDGIDIDDCHIPVQDREEIDKWLLSKYHKLLKTCTEAYDKYDLNEVVKNITSFVSDDLSNWYIRRNRNRFWSSTLDNSKKAVYMTTYEVLVGLCKLCAPIIPYTTEEIYKNLTGEESVHLSDFPVYDEAFINDEIEEKMDLVRNLISNGRYVREETKIKVRQPISECFIDGKYESILGDLVNLIHEELNVKKVIFVDDLSEYMNFIVKPNFKVAGKILGPKIKEFTSKLESLTEEEVNTLNQGNMISISLSGETYEVNKDMVDIRVSSKEGFNVGMENNDFIILNTTLTDDLIKEGIAREFISKVQNMRKTNDFNIIDRISVSYMGDELVKEAIQDYHEFISSEILATSLKEDTIDGEFFDLNGHETKIVIEKNK